ncbi:MAG TPA: hypothetical protein VGM94_04945 [Galbitalea sp.]
MTVTQLASTTDVEAAMGRALTSDESSRVGAILDKASELFRRRSGQQFTPGTSDVRLRVLGRKVTLTQRPIVSVESVRNDGEYNQIAVPFSLDGSILWVDGSCSGGFVRVAYTHGGEVPDVVRLAIADLARRVLSIDPNAVTGLTQHGETTGPFSKQDSYATWAQGGQTMLSPDDQALADSFKINTGGLIVQGGYRREFHG